MKPYRVLRPTTAEPSAVVYDSPHSGRYYPPDFASHASHLELRRGEDAYVDELLLDAPGFGVSLLVANYARCYIDLNRAESDLDAALLSEPWPEPIHPTEKTQRGLGLIRRFVVPGVEAQAGPLTVAQVRHRIEQVHRPYWSALRQLVHEVSAIHRTVYHVNWHSMKSRGNAMTPDGPNATRPDFVVSDVNGRSAAGAMTELIVETLRAMGHTVGVNDPYSGGTIVQSVGSPATGLHSVQIEINRRLYLDETAVEKAEGFAQLRDELGRLTRRLIDYAKSVPA